MKQLLISVFQENVFAEAVNHTLRLSAGSEDYSSDPDDSMDQTRPHILQVSGLKHSGSSFGLHSPDNLDSVCEGTEQVNSTCYHKDFYISL